MRTVVIGATLVAGVLGVLAWVWATRRAQRDRALIDSLIQPATPTAGKLSRDEYDALLEAAEERRRRAALARVAANRIATGDRQPAPSLRRVK